MKPDEHSSELIFQLLNVISEYSSTGGWVYYPDSQTLFWTEQTKILHEVDEEFIPTVENAINFYHPDDRDSISEYFTRLVDDGVAFSLDLRLITAKGNTIWANAIGNPLYEGDSLVCVFGAFRDLTKRKESESLILRYEQFSNVMTSKLRVIPWVLDLDTFQFKYVGEHAEEITGYSEPEWKAAGFWESHIFESDKFSAIDFCISQTNANKDHEFEYRFVKSNGEIVWFHDKVVIAEDKLTGNKELQGLMIDVTQIKEMERKEKTNLIQTVSAIAKALESRDPYTSGHMTAVANLAIRLGKKLGMNSDRIYGLYLGSSIFDIGKIAVPADILSRPGALKSYEFEIVKEHCENGNSILEGIDFRWPVKNMVMQHHERIDGKGYPNGLKEDEICYEAKIISILDTFEAVSSHRPYRSALEIDEVKELLREGKGSKFDSRLVDSFLELLDEQPNLLADARLGDIDISDL